MVQWLKLGTFIAVDPGSIPGLGIKIPKAGLHSHIIIIIIIINIYNFSKDKSFSTHAVIKQFLFCFVLFFKCWFTYAPDSSGERFSI